MTVGTNLWRWLRCLWSGHEVEMVEHLNMLARVRCVRCERDFVIHRYEPGMVPWTKQWEEFFAEHRLICERWFGGIIDWPSWADWK